MFNFPNVCMEVTAHNACKLIRDYDPTNQRIIMDRISGLLRLDLPETNSLVDIPSQSDRVEGLSEEAQTVVFDTDRLLLRTNVKEDRKGAGKLKDSSIDKGLFRLTMDEKLLIHKRTPEDANADWDPIRAYSVGFKPDTNVLYYIGDKRQECIFWRSGEMDPSYKLVDYVEC